MEHFPTGSRFLKINTAEKEQAAVLDQLLDGTSEATVGINGVQIPVNTLQISQLTFNGNIAFIIISPKGASTTDIPVTQE